MSRLVLGTICGIVYGALSAASMIPLSFSDKRAALLGAFLNRFSIGFVIGAARLPLPGWASGLIFGILLSLPDAIITKAYAPILGLGSSGGTDHWLDCWQMGGLTPVKSSDKRQIPHRQLARSRTRRWAMTFQNYDHGYTL